MIKSMHKTVKVMTIVAMVAIIMSPVLGSAVEKKLVVGSKEFTEQRILGQIMIQLLESRGFVCEDKTGLGGTLVMRKALESNQIDICMEYTGTALVTHLKQKDIITDPQKCYEFVKATDLEKNDLVWLPYVPFNNTYCLMMRADDAKQKGIATLSDLAAYVQAHKNDIAFGMNAEFYARPDGYKPLQKKYDFKFPRNKIVKMSSGLLYKALKENEVAVAIGFATDGRIKGFDLVVLQDDKNYFPVYNPAPVVTAKTAEKFPELVQIFTELAAKLDTAAMTEMNYQVDGEHKNVKDVAKNWLESVGLI